ncbi:hypothetical protein NXF25_000915 [Crotalus adamanteus]|uniref:Uncharacterized protein n=1 Tax=Crotalus adamanteus TaxID=8729 RepID=A0AAW1C862_CROAD
MYLFRYQLLQVK